MSKFDEIVEVATEKFLETPKARKERLKREKLIKAGKIAAGIGGTALVGAGVNKYYSKDAISNRMNRYIDNHVPGSHTKQAVSELTVEFDDTINDLHRQMCLAPKGSPERMRLKIELDNIEDMEDVWSHAAAASRRRYRQEYLDSHPIEKHLVAKRAEKKR